MNAVFLKKSNLLLRSKRKAPTGQNASNSPRVPTHNTASYKCSN